MAGKSKVVSDELAEKARQALKRIGTGGETVRGLQAIIAARTYIPNTNEEPDFYL